MAQIVSREGLGSVRIRGGGNTIWKMRLRTYFPSQLNFLLGGLSRLKMRNNTLQREWLTRDIYQSGRTITETQTPYAESSSKWMTRVYRFCHLGTELYEPLEPGHEGMEAGHSGHSRKTSLQSKSRQCLSRSPTPAVGQWLEGASCLKCISTCTYVGECMLCISADLIAGPKT